eukprot:TRINITY_DN15245_c0_g2_i1.p1 TRINITY_DN15245_c0_g2~~TRINITY_DN15245_c0_g2_i1.p1  ORF type:complete len:112 (+),score=2.76 TRINITY_DN15245_c0_g2_i1:135-470(+)
MPTPCPTDPTVSIKPGLGSLGVYCTLSSAGERYLEQDELESDVSIVRRYVSRVTRNSTNKGLSKGSQQNETLLMGQTSGGSEEAQTTPTSKSHCTFDEVSVLPDRRLGTRQ